MRANTRILWFNWKDIRHPEAGGAEAYTHEIAKRLIKMGHLVTLFTCSFENSPREEMIDGINIVRSGGKYTVYRRARKYFREFGEKFDVVVDGINTRPFMTPDFVRSGKIVALIFQLAREFWFDETPFPLSILGYYVLERKWLKRYSQFPTVTISESTKHDLEGLGFSNISIVTPGVSVEPADDVPQKSLEPSIVFVGRMKKAKRPQDVIAAFRIVKKELPSSELWMIGDGYMLDRLKNEAADVHFCGYLDKESRDEIIRRCWVAAVPGVREGWGLVVTESNALGTPVVAYDIPGLRDSVKDGYNGTLVASNVHAMASGLVTLLKNHELRKTLSDNALEWSRRFSWDKAADEFCTTLTEATGATP